ncbi:MAG TPA: tryptophan 2,3-dioxygenase family protein [Solirubrobacteraceae bacterium]|nr:tryptophan 2,3-dioxygenase family protein [Solirubrobacteraceae bacterium]
MRLVVHVDGGSRGNPGPAAAAAVTSTPDGEVVDETAVVLGRATNNVAEYRALLLGLERARALGATEVEVVNDSELVANQVNGRYRVKSPELAALHGDVMRALEGIDRWEVRPVPRAENAAADALVNQALDAAGDATDGEPTEYAGYLRIDDLLRLQEPLTPEAHDELLFIVVHQSYELWFKLILHELAAAREELERGRPQAAIRPLQRTAAIDRLLLVHLDVLETMGPDGFLEFRDPLAPASGFQSTQFRAIERESPPLYDAFTACAGLPDDPRERLTALAELYRDHLDDPRRALLYQVAELLVDHDELIALWRHHHTLMAAREIGSRHGTGGSRGVEYLRGTQDKRFYPELWEVRSAL